MTLPIERYHAIINVRAFLLSLMNPKETKRIPSEIRREARWLLKHFPTEYDMQRAAKDFNKIFEVKK